MKVIPILVLFCLNTSPTICKAKWYLIETYSKESEAGTDYTDGGDGGRQQSFEPLHIQMNDCRNGEGANCQTEQLAEESEVVGAEGASPPAAGWGGEKVSPPSPGWGGEQTTPPPAPGWGGEQTTPAPGWGGEQTTPPPAPGWGGEPTTPPPAPGWGGEQTTPAPGWGGEQTTPPPAPGWTTKGTCSEQTTPQPVQPGECPAPPGKPHGEDGDPCIGHSGCFADACLICVRKEGEQQGVCKSVTCTQDSECEAATGLPSQCTDGQCVPKQCVEDGNCLKGMKCFEDGNCKTVYGGSCKLDCDCTKCEDAVCFKDQCFCKDDSDKCSISGGNGGYGPPPNGGYGQPGKGGADYLGN